MLEQLGLGIILSFEDNFSSQANNAINSMLNLETKAESMANNVQKSLNNLQNLMLSGFSLSQIGDEFSSLGAKIVGGFKTAFSEIANASAKMETYKAQFKTVFGKDADKNMSWAVKYAVETPFELNQLVSNMQKMGSQKIDVSKMFKSKQGGNKPFMEYMGDLATRNMDANGGIDGMAIAVSNAWSGQLRSLQQRFDLASSSLEGLKKYAGKDLNKFMEEFVKLADEYAPNAMKNLQGTWEQTLSNMDDAWFNLKFRIGDKGDGADVFGSMKKSLNKVAELLFELSENSTMLGTLRNLFNDLWKPVDKLVDVLTKAVRAMFKFAEAHPVLTSIIAKFVAFSGVGLVLVGTLMKLTGGFMIFTTSLVSAYANLKILKSLNLGGDLTKISSGLGLVASSFKTVALVAGAVGLAYKFNIGGMKKIVDDTIASLSKADEYKNKLLSTNSLNISNLIGQRHSSIGNEVGYLMAKFEALKLVAKDSYEVVTKGHSDVLKNFATNHYDLVSHFGLEKFATYSKPIFESILSFVRGFRQGLEVAFKTTVDTFNILLTPLRALKAVFSQIFGGSSNSDTLNNLQALKDLLGSVGRVAGSVLGTILGFKVVKSLSGVLLSPFKALLNILGKVGDKASNVMKKFNPSNWYNKGSMNSYLSTMETRQKLKGVTGAKTEAEYEAMGLGLNRSQQRAGYLYQKALIEDTTGRKFSDKQMEAMGFTKPDSAFTAMIKDIKGVFTKGIDAIKNRAELTNTGLSNDPKSKFNPVKLDTVHNPLDNSLDNTLFAGKHGYNGADTLQVAKRPKFLDTLFGQKFYSVNEDGTRNSLGTYGGAFTKRKDNNQMRLASQLAGIKLKSRSEFNSERDYRDYLKNSVVRPDKFTGAYAKDLDGYLENTTAYQKVNKRLADYIGSGQKGAGQFRISPKMSAEKQAEIRRARQRVVMGILNNDEDVLSDFKYKNDAKISGVSGLFNQELAQTGNQKVFAKKQNALSKFLFGQKLYTINQDAKGQLYENQVARVGGIFRNRADDGTYNPKGDQRLGTRIKSGAKALGKASLNDALNFKDYITPKIKTFATGLKGGLTQLGNEMAFSASAFKDYLNLSPTFNKVKDATSKVGGLLKNTGLNIAEKLGNSKLFKGASTAFSGIAKGASIGFTELIRNSYALKDTASTVFSGAKGLASSALTKLGETKIGGAIKNSNIGNLVSGLGSNLKGNLSNAIKNVITNTKAMIPQKPAFIDTLANTNIGQMASSGISALGDRVKGVLSHINEIGVNRPSTLGRIKNVASNISEKVSTSRPIQAVRNFSPIETIKSIPNRVSSKASGFAERIVNSRPIQTLRPSNIAGAFSKIPSSIASKASGFAERVANSRPIQTISNLNPFKGKSVMDSPIKNSKPIRQIVNVSEKFANTQLGGKLSNLGSSIGGKISSLAGGMKASGINALNRLKNFTGEGIIARINDLIAFGKDTSTSALKNLSNSKLFESIRSLSKINLSPLTNKLNSLKQIGLNATNGLLNKFKSTSKNDLESKTSGSFIGKATNKISETTGSIFSGIKNSNLFNTLSNFRPVKAISQGVANKVQSVKLAGSSISSLLKGTDSSKTVGRIKEAINTSKLGQTIITKTPSTLGGAMLGLGRGFMTGAGAVAGAGGKVIRGTAGVIGTVGRVGKTAGKLGMGAVRGTVGLARGAVGLGMGALGMASNVMFAGMLANSAIGGIKSIGSNLNNNQRASLAKKRGLKQDDNLGLGLAKISQDLSKFDFSKFWANFKKSSKQMIPVFKDIFKDIVRIGKQSFPTLVKEVAKVAKSVASQLPQILAKLPSQMRKIVKGLSPILKGIWDGLKIGLNNFITGTLPKLPSNDNSID